MRISTDIRIAITAMHDKKIWANGLYQNLYHLYNMLTSAGYNVDLVVESEKISKCTFMGNELRYLTPDNISDYDIVLEVANTLKDKTSKKYINEDKGVAVTIHYGNEFLLNTVCNTLYYPDDVAKTFRPPRQAMWISPHFTHSQEALEILHKTKVEVCPYIWSPKFLLNKNKEEDLLFNSNSNPANVAVMESNLYFVKTCHIPMLIIEKTYRDNPTLIDAAYIIGSERLKNSKTFVSFANDLTGTKTGLISYEPRYKFPHLIKKGISGTIVSHQTFNALNYLQLEAMYLGIPFVHNSPFFKNHGYYYEDFNAKQGARQLHLAITCHKNIYEYTREVDRKKIYEFHPENSKNIEGYANLIESLVSEHLVRNQPMRITL